MPECRSNATKRLQAEFGLCTEDGYSNARDLGSSDGKGGSLCKKSHWQSSGNGLLTSLGLAAALRFCRGPRDLRLGTWEKSSLQSRPDGLHHWLGSCLVCI